MQHLNKHPVNILTSDMYVCVDVYVSGSVCVRVCVCLGGMGASVLCFLLVVNSSDNLALVQFLYHYQNRQVKISGIK